VDLGFGCLNQIINSALGCIGQCEMLPRAHSNLKADALAFHFGSLLDLLVTGICVHDRFLAVQEISGGRKVVYIRSGRSD